MNGIPPHLRTSRTLPKQGENMSNSKSHPTQRHIHDLEVLAGFPSFVVRLRIKNTGGLDTGAWRASRRSNRHTESALFVQSLSSSSFASNQRTKYGTPTLNESVSRPARRIHPLLGDIQQTPKEAIHDAQVQSRRHLICFPSLALWCASASWKPLFSSPKLRPRSTRVHPNLATRTQ